MSMATPHALPTNAPGDSHATKTFTRLLRSKSNGQHPDVEFFQVRTTDDKRYVLRYSAHEDEWTLQSDFDGPELFARPGIEVVTVGAAQIREAASRIDGCEHCRPDEAEIPFDWILGEVTGRSGMVDFLMTGPAKCPKCFREVTEKTLVEW